MVAPLAPLAAASGGVTDYFWLGLGVIFLSGLVSAVVRQRRRDRVLRLFDGFRVTVVMTDGRTIWGRLRVSGQGVEVVYDAPWVGPGGKVKRSYLLYPPDLDQVLCLCRHASHLSADERERRNRQVEVTFRPGLARTALRHFQNAVNTIHDAFQQALGFAVGQFAKAGVSPVLAKQRGEVEKVGKTLLGVAARAYEPLLERHLGEPIVAEMVSPADPDKERVELVGYLAEYSQNWLGVFHPTDERGEAGVWRVPLDEASRVGPVEVTVEQGEVQVRNDGEDPIVVRTLQRPDGTTRPLCVALPRAAHLRLAGLQPGHVLVVAQARSLDIVCRRAHAAVRHASSFEPPPASAACAAPPAHRDNRPDFP